MRAARLLASSFIAILLLGLSSQLFAARPGGGGSSPPCTAVYPQAYFDLLNNPGTNTCYILVHGHRSSNGTTNGVGATQSARDYWYSEAKTEDSEQLLALGFPDKVMGPPGTPQTFQKSCTYTSKGSTLTYVEAGSAVTLTPAEDHFFVVGYASQNAYDHANAANLAASQIYSARTGATDGLSHSRQCNGNETNFIVVGHSMGGPVTRYINGRAALPPSDPNYNVTFDLAINGDGNVPPVTALVNIGGANIGTEGADYVCGGSLLSGVARLFLGNCDAGTYSLRTSSSVRLDGKIGSNAASPALLIGGYGSLGGALGVSSAFLSGEDDGVVNLHTQMDCTNIALSDAATNGWQEGGYPDVKIWRWNACGFLNLDQCWYVSKWCDQQDKSLGRSHNFLSQNDNHDNQRNGKYDSIDNNSAENYQLGSRNSNESGILSNPISTCDSNLNAPGHIRSCLGTAMGAPANPL